MQTKKIGRRLQRLERRAAASEGRLAQDERTLASVLTRLAVLETGRRAADEVRSEVVSRVRQHDGQTAALARRLTDVECALTGVIGLGMLARRLERIEARLEQESAAAGAEAQTDTDAHAHEAALLCTGAPIVGRYCTCCGQVTAGSEPAELHVCGLCQVETLPVTSWPGLAVG